MYFQARSHFSSGVTHMHARPPPKNDLLCVLSANVDDIDDELPVASPVDDVTHKFPRTPGILTLVTVSGNGLSHRSGFHSSASSPHIALLRLDE